MTAPDALVVRAARSAGLALVLTSCLPGPLIIDPGPDADGSTTDAVSATDGAAMESTVPDVRTGEDAVAEADALVVIPDVVVDADARSDADALAVADTGLDADTATTLDADGGLDADASLPPDVPTGTDARADTDAAIVPIDTSPESDAGTTDATADAATRPSCPDPTERGCGVVAVTGGTFTLGEDVPADWPRSVPTTNWTTYWGASATPPLPNITVHDFRLDATEVTVRRFRRWWSSGHPTPSAPVRYPGGRTLPLLGAVHVDAMSTRTPPCNWTDLPTTREEHPINCITWSTALAFCAWDGGRLPTNAEWEYVARDRPVAGLPSPRVYPWGNGHPSPPCDQAQWNHCPGEDGAVTRRVGSFPPSGGFYDLAGNMGELVADQFTMYGSAPCWAPGPQTDPLCQPATGPNADHEVRGGNYATTGVSSLSPDEAIELRNSFRSSSSDDDSTLSLNAGFRCAHESL